MPSSTGSTEYQPFVNGDIFTVSASIRNCRGVGTLEGLTFRELPAFVNRENHEKLVATAKAACLATFGARNSFAFRVLRYWDPPNGAKRQYLAYLYLGTDFASWPEGLSSAFLAARYSLALNQVVRVPLDKLVTKENGFVEATLVLPHVYSRYIPHRKGLKKVTGFISPVLRQISSEIVNGKEVTRYARTTSVGCLRRLLQAQSRPCRRSVRTCSPAFA